MLGAFDSLSTFLQTAMGISHQALPKGSGQQAVGDCYGQWTSALVDLSGHRLMETDLEAVKLLSFCS